MNYWQPDSVVMAVIILAALLINMFFIWIVQPFNATRITASGISDRVKELEKDGMNKEQKNSKKGFWEEF